MERADVEQLSLLTDQKRCYKCGELKALEDFNRNSKAPDGRRPDCRSCHRASVRAYAQEHREERLAYCRHYYLANREERLERQREYGVAHAEQRRAYVAVRQAAPEYREARRVYEKQYWDERRDEARAKGHRWRARQKAATVSPITDAARSEKWIYWNGCCWICGGPADSWDHVKPLSKGGPHVLSNLRPACRSCNSRKKDTWPFSI